MKLYPTLIWIFTILAFAFLFFSLRSSKDQLTYSLVALGCWGAAYLINRFKPKPEDSNKDS